MMPPKIIEATSGVNWGRFLLLRYDQERTWPSQVTVGPTIWGRNVPSDTAVWILDLITAEGAVFDLVQPLEAQLARHQIWVCVLYEPFLRWLEQRMLEAGSIDRLWNALPAVVTLAEAPELLGYRHGRWLEELPDDARAFLVDPRVTPVPLPRSLLQLLKKLLPTSGPRPPQGAR